MDLRAQLAVQEEELAHLKRKWERIIGRKLGHASGLGLAGPLPAEGTTANGSAAMLDGLKEGMQGAARLLVAGLADLSAVAPISVAPPDGTGNQTPAKPKVVTSHQATYSTSSASTSPSPRFSTTSTSSLESLSVEEKEDVTATTPTPSASSTIPAHAEIGQSSARKAGLTSRPSMRQRRSGENSRTVPQGPPELSSSPPPMTTLPTSPQSTSIPSLFDGLADPASSPPVAPVSDWVKRKWAAADGSGSLRDANRRASTLLAGVGQRGQSWLASFSATSKPATPEPELSAASTPSQTVSLLDDEDDDPWATAAAGSVLVPDTPLSASVGQDTQEQRTSDDDFGNWASTVPAAKASTTSSKADDFDDWNW
jgi:hypothetical protein